MTDIREQEMQNRIDALVLEKANLANENSYLKEQIAYLKKLAFGSRTEKTKRIMGEDIEINLFDEAEVEAKASALEPVIEVPAHKRRKKTKGRLEDKGALLTDGYAGYEQASCRAHALCWAHARRYFVEALPPRPETGRGRRFHQRPGHQENKRAVCPG
jgi:hypothetical protein